MAFISVYYCLLNTISQFLWACGAQRSDYMTYCGELAASKAEKIVDLRLKL